MNGLRRRFRGIFVAAVRTIRLYKILSIHLHFDWLLKWLVF